eukprot:scaffold108166_cov28-Tisochrysis_lutea.AAC.1
MLSAALRPSASWMVRHALVAQPAVARRSAGMDCWMACGKTRAADERARRARPGEPWDGGGPSNTRSTAAATAPFARSPTASDHARRPIISTAVAAAAAARGGCRRPEPPIVEAGTSTAAQSSRSSGERPAREASPSSSPASASPASTPCMVASHTATHSHMAHKLAIGGTDQSGASEGCVRPGEVCAPEGRPGGGGGAAAGPSPSSLATCVTHAWVGAPERSATEHPLCVGPGGVTARTPPASGWGPAAKPGIPRAPPLLGEGAADEPGVREPAERPGE